MRARVGQKVKPQEKPPEKPTEQHDGARTANEAVGPQTKD
jgi:hypothetical protein